MSLFKKKSKVQEPTHKTDLQKVYEYFLHGIDSTQLYGDSFYPVSSYEYARFVENKVYNFILELYNFKGLPQVVSDEEFKNIDQNNLYHGFREYDFGKQFLTGDLFVGNGITGGFFFTKFKKEAIDLYTKSSTTCKADSSKVLTAKVMPNKLINYTLLKFYRNIILYGVPDLILDESLGDFEKKLKTIQALRKVIPDQDKNKFVEIYNFLNNDKDDFVKGFVAVLTNNLSILALLLGYDAIEYNKIIGTVSADDYFIVLNRANVVVPRSEFDKFNEKANGVSDPSSNPQMGEE